MSQHKGLFLSFTFLVIGAMRLVAQQGFIPVGGESTGSGGNVSYSVGQLDYIVITDNGGSVSQGLQQTYTILIGIEQLDPNLETSVYPNPATEFVILSVPEIQIKGMSYSLYDMNGKLIISQNLTENNTKIAISELANGIYFIKLFKYENIVNSFKLIKT